METFRIEFRSRFKNSSGEWTDWEDLDHEDYESVEDAREALEEEKRWDEKVSSKVWDYDYRIVDILKRAVAVADDSASEALADDLGTVSVPKERFELLEGIEARLEAEWQELQTARESTAHSMVQGMVADVPNLEALKVSEDWLIELTGRQKLLNKIMGKD